MAGEIQGGRSPLLVHGFRRNGILRLEDALRAGIVYCIPPNIEYDKCKDGKINTEDEEKMGKIEKSS